MRMDMKTVKITLLILALSFMVSGCDFFRSLVGRPTSAELEALRLEAAAKTELQRHMEDSLKAAAETAELMEAQKSVSMESLDYVSDNDRRYHVVPGSFKNPENAERFICLLKEKGYTPKKIKFRNGFTVISVYGDDDFHKAVKVMEETLEYEFCPDDIWIYDIRQHLHE